MKLSYSLPAISAVESVPEAFLLADSLTSGDGEDMLVTDNEIW